MAKTIKDVAETLKENLKKAATEIGSSEKEKRKKEPTETYSAVYNTASKALNESQKEAPTKAQSDALKAGMGPVRDPNKVAMDRAKERTERSRTTLQKKDGRRYEYSLYASRFDNSANELINAQDQGASDEELKNRKKEVQDYLSIIQKDYSEFYNVDKSYYDSRMSLLDPNTRRRNTYFGRFADNYQKAYEAQEKGDYIESQKYTQAARSDVEMIKNVDPTFYEENKKDFNTALTGVGSKRRIELFDSAVKEAINAQDSGDENAKVYVNAVDARLHDIKNNDPELYKDNKDYFDFQRKMATDKDYRTYQLPFEQAYANYSELVSNGASKEELAEAEEKVFSTYNDMKKAYVGTEYGLSDVYFLLSSSMEPYEIAKQLAKWKQNVYEELAPSKELQQATPNDSQMKKDIENAKATSETFFNSMVALTYEREAKKDPDFEKKSKYKKKDVEYEFNNFWDGNDFSKYPVDDSKHLYNLINGDSEAINVDKSAALYGYSLQGDRLKYTYAPDKVIAMFNYLYETKGPDVARQYIDAFEEDFENARAYAEAENATKLAKEDPIGSTLFSIINPIYHSPEMAITALTDVMSGTGEKTENDYAWRHLRDAGITQQTVSDSIDNPILRSLYSGAVAHGNSLAMAAMGPVGPIYGALNTFATDTHDANVRGLSGWQALSIGATTAAIELFTESKSFDALFDSGTLKKGWRQYVKNNLITELTGELGAQLAGDIVDGIFAQDLSEWNLKMDKYIADGDSQIEAFKKTLTDYSINYLNTAGATLFSTGAMTVTPAIGSRLARSNANRTIGQSLKQSGKASEIFEMASGFEKGTETAKLYERYKSEGITAENAPEIAIGKLTTCMIEDSTTIIESGEYTAEAVGRSQNTISRIENMVYDPSSRADVGTFAGNDDNVDINSIAMSATDSAINDIVEANTDTSDTATAEIQADGKNTVSVTLRDGSKTVVNGTKYRKIQGHTILVVEGKDIGGDQSYYAVDSKTGKTVASGETKSVVHEKIQALKVQYEATDENGNYVLDFYDAPTAMDIPVEASLTEDTTDAPESDGASYFAPAESDLGGDVREDADGVVTTESEVTPEEGDAVEDTAEYADVHVKVKDGWIDTKGEIIGTVGENTIYLVDGKSLGVSNDMFAVNGKTGLPVARGGTREAVLARASESAKNYFGSEFVPKASNLSDKGVADRTLPSPAALSTDGTGATVADSVPAVERDGASYFAPAQSDLSTGEATSPVETVAETGDSGKKSTVTLIGANGLETYEGVSVAEDTGYDLTAVERNGGITIVEKRSGMEFAHGATVEEAVANVRNKIAENGKAAVDTAVEKTIERRKARIEASAGSTSPIEGDRLSVGRAVADAEYTGTLLEMAKTSKNKKARKAAELYSSYNFKNESESYRALGDIAKILGVSEADLVKSRAKALYAKINASISDETNIVDKLDSKLYEERKAAVDRGDTATVKAIDYLVNVLNSEGGIISVSEMFAPNQYSAENPNVAVQVYGKRMETAFKNIGLDISVSVYYDSSENAARGEWTKHPDGHSEIRLNGAKLQGEQSAFWVVSHELIHEAESKSPGITQRMLDAFTRMGMYDGSQYEAYKARYSKKCETDFKKALDRGDVTQDDHDEFVRNYVNEEIVADLMSETMSSSELVEVFAGKLGKDDSNVIVSFLKWIKNGIKKVFNSKDEFPNKFSDIIGMFEGAVKGTDTKISDTEVTKKSFAGKKANSADLSLLEQARDMENNGRNADEILKETGWYKGADGEWRFEIDDSKMEVNTSGKFTRDPEKRRYIELFDKVFLGTDASEQEVSEFYELDKKLGKESFTPTKLGDLINHPDLFKAYPELEDVNIAFVNTNENSDGAYDPILNGITLERRNNIAPERLKSVLIHEIQHAIQQIEGFASGSSTEYWQSEIDIGRTDGSRSAKDLYRNTAGEIEAREAASRKNLSAEERRERMPFVKDENTVFVDENGNTSNRWKNSEIDYPIDQNIQKIVNDAFSSGRKMNEISIITPAQNKAINRLVNTTRNDAYRGKYTGGKHLLSNDAIRHILAEHGDFLREALRAQLPMTKADIARHLSAVKDGKHPTETKPSNTRQGNPSIITSYEVNGYTLYAEEITKSSGNNNPNNLIGHTMYKAPTLSTAAFYATSAQTQPKRQDMVLRKYYTTDSINLSRGNFVSDTKGEPALLTYTTSNGVPKQNESMAGLIALSSDKANFTDKINSFGQGYVVCKKPYYITTDNKVFSDSETNVAESINELKKQGYDCFIFDKVIGDNYMVAVVNKAQIIDENVRFENTDSSQENNSDSEYLELAKNPEKNDTTTRKSLTDTGVYSLEDAWAEKVKKYGAIPRGEKAARDIKVPKKISDNKYVSRTARSAIEAGITPAEFVPELQKEILDGKFTYERFPDDKAEAKAKETIEYHGFEGALEHWEFLMHSGGAISKENFSLGIALYNQCAQNGDFARAEKILADLSVEATRAGQAIQSMRLLKKMSADGTMYYLEKSIDKINDELVEKFGEKRAKKVKINEELARKYFAEKDAKKREKLYDELCKDIGEQIPSTFWEKADAWRYVAMLFNPTTHIRNVAGNIFNKFVIMADHAVEGALQPILVKRENRTRTWRIADKKTADFAKNDWELMRDVLTSGEGKYNNMMSDIDENRRILRPSKNAGKATKAVGNAIGFIPEVLRKFNSWGLEAEDAIFLGASYKSALCKIITARKLNVDNITPEQLSEIRDLAMKDALRATFREANWLAESISKAKSNLMKGNAGQKLAGVALGGVFPFTKTPMNITKQALEHSPLGVFKTASDIVKKARGGAVSGNDIIADLARTFTGTGLAALGFVLAKAGFVSAGDDEDPDKKRFDKLVGEQSYAITVGGKSYTIDWATPASIPFLVGAQLFDATSDSGINIKTAMDSLTKIAEPVIGLSMLDGLRDFMQSDNYAEGQNPLFAGAYSTLESYVLQFFPTLGGKIHRIYDGEKKNYYFVDKNSNVPEFVQELYGSVASKLPFAVGNFQPSVDLWGRIENHGGIGERLAENLISPGYYSEENYTEVDEELLRLYESTGNGDVFPKKMYEDITIDGHKYYMNAEHYTEAAIMLGERRFDMLSRLFNDEIVLEKQDVPYSEMSDSEKAKIVSDVYYQALDETKYAMFDKVRKNSAKYGEVPEIDTATKIRVGKENASIMYNSDPTGKNAYDLELYSNADNFIYKSSQATADLSQEEKDEAEKSILEYAKSFPFEGTRGGELAANFYDKMRKNKKSDIKFADVFQQYSPDYDLKVTVDGKEYKANLDTEDYIDYHSNVAAAQELLRLACFGSEEEVNLYGSGILEEYKDEPWMNIITSAMENIPENDEDRLAVYNGTMDKVTNNIRLSYKYKYIPEYSMGSEYADDIAVRSSASNDAYNLDKSADNAYRREIYGKADDLISKSNKLIDKLPESEKEEAAEIVSDYAKGFKYEESTGGKLLAEAYEDVYGDVEDPELLADTVFDKYSEYSNITLKVDGEEYKEDFTVEDYIEYNETFADADELARLMIFGDSGVNKEISSIRKKHKNAPWLMVLDAAKANVPKGKKEKLEYYIKVRSDVAASIKEPYKYEYIDAYSSGKDEIDNFFTRKSAFDTVSKYYKDDDGNISNADIRGRKNFYDIRYGYIDKSIGLIEDNPKLTKAEKAKQMDDLAKYAKGLTYAPTRGQKLIMSVYEDYGVNEKTYNKTIDKAISRTDDPTLDKLYYNSAQGVTVDKTVDNIPYTITLSQPDYINMVTSMDNVQEYAALYIFDGAAAANEYKNTLTVEEQRWITSGVNEFNKSSKNVKKLADTGIISEESLPAYYYYALTGKLKTQVRASYRESYFESFAEEANTPDGYYVKYNP